MAAPVRIEARAWTDPRFATLARLLGLERSEFALILCAKIWSWQTENYTVETPTDVVDADTLESILGPSGPAALVRAKLADETPDGYRMRGTEGQIEWHAGISEKRQRAGRARAVKAKRDALGRLTPDENCNLDNSRPAHAGCAGQQATSTPPAKSSSPTPALVPEEQEEDLSRAGAHAIPPSTEQARGPTPTPAPAPAPAPPPPAIVAPKSDLRLNAPLPPGASEHRTLWRELEQARAEAAAELGVQVMPLVFGEVGERDLSSLLAAARARGPDELDKLVRQARHAIAMAKLETVNGEKPFEWFTGAVFSQNNFRRLVAKNADDAKRVRAGPYGASSRYRDSQPEQPRKTQIL
jgi:hypothetical protein